VLLLKKAGLGNRRYRHICCYVLHNYKDTPADLFERIKHLLAIGVAAYPMRYQPLSGENAFEKDSYVAPTWTTEELDMVAAARRVIGYGGAFPPYEGLVNKFRFASDFHDAFGLRERPDRRMYPDSPVAKKEKKTGFGFELREFAWDLIEMGKDHQFPVPIPDGLIQIVGRTRIALPPGTPKTNGKNGNGHAASANGNGKKAQGVITRERREHDRKKKPLKIQVKPSPLADAVLAYDQMKRARARARAAAKKAKGHRGVAKKANGGAHRPAAKTKQKKVHAGVLKNAKARGNERRSSRA
jgi:hypothetical protein